MSCSAEGILFYGWILKKETMFPWDHEEMWWEEVNNYKPLYNGNNLTKEQTKANDDYKDAWYEKNPLPFRIEFYGVEPNEKYVIAIGKSKLAYEDTIVSVESLKKSKKQVEFVRQLIETHFPEVKEEPKWWLASRINMI